MFPGTRQQGDSIENSPNRISKGGTTFLHDSNGHAAERKPVSGMHRSQSESSKRDQSMIQHRTADHHDNRVNNYSNSRHHERNNYSHGSGSGNIVNNSINDHQHFVTGHDAGHSVTKDHYDKNFKPHNSSQHHHEMFMHGLIMMLDGIGLAMVAGATILEGVVLWKAFFHSYWDTFRVSLVFWFIGRACQVIGLMALIVFAATFETFSLIEATGMTLITIGPLFNTIAANLFTARNDPLLLFNKAWRTSEAIEFTGMATLCISYIDMDDLLVFLTELVGFICLCCAATMEFQYFPTTPIPHVEVRWDLVHSSECIGLMMLIVVSFAQYRMRIHKARMDARHKQSDEEVQANSLQHRYASNNGTAADVDHDSTNNHHHHRYQVDRDEIYSASHYMVEGTSSYRVDIHHDDSQKRRSSGRAVKPEIMMV